MNFHQWNPTPTKSLPIGTKVGIRSGGRIVGYGTIVEILPRGYDGTYGVRIDDDGSANAGFIEAFYAKDLLVLRPR